MGIDEKTVKDGINGMTDKDVKRAAKRTGRAKHKANASILKKLVTRIHEVANLLNDYADKRYRKIAWWSVSAIAFLVLYVANPFDMVPDMIPVLGYCDDLFVATIVLSMVEQDIKNWRVWRKEYDKELKKKKKKKKENTTDKD
jgi:uncharacterized membrane protein YkvA (DUF1232 family)